MPPGGTEAAARVRIWDLPLRLFHWALVVCVVGAWWLAEPARDVHELLGYGALALVAFRLVWGFIGSAHARFASFFPTPARLFPYLRALSRGREPRHLGHNPAGALMMLFLLAVVTALGATGWALTTDWGFGDETLETLHHWLVDALLVAVPLHVLGAIVTGWRHRENLVRSMVDGKKRPLP